jgi:hypothetical protein
VDVERLVLGLDAYGSRLRIGRLVGEQLGCQALDHLRVDDVPAEITALAVAHRMDAIPDDEPDLVRIGLSNRLEQRGKLRHGKSSRAVVRSLQQRPGQKNPYPDSAARHGHGVLGEKP